MEAFGLPTSFGRAKPVNKNAQSSASNTQNNKNDNNRGGRKGNSNARTSPYPSQGAAAVAGEQVERSFGAGRGRGRGRGGNGRGRGGARVSNTSPRNLSAYAYEYVNYRDETTLEDHPRDNEPGFPLKRQRRERRSTVNLFSRTLGRNWRPSHKSLNVRGDRSSRYR